LSRRYPWGKAPRSVAAVPLSVAAVPFKASSCTRQWPLAARAW
jgi:hypothetical protein